MLQTVKMQTPPWNVARSGGGRTAQPGVVGGIDYDSVEASTQLPREAQMTQPSGLMRPSSMLGGDGPNDMETQRLEQQEQEHRLGEEEAQERFLLGSLMERSISAPLDNHEQEAFRHPHQQQRRSDREAENDISSILSMNSMSLGRNTTFNRLRRFRGEEDHGTGPTSTSLLFGGEDSLFSRLSKPATDDSLIGTSSDTFRGGLSSTVARPLGNLSERQAAGDGLLAGVGGDSSTAVAIDALLARSQSAAPDFVSNRHRGSRPPPGLSPGGMTAHGGAAMADVSGGGSVLFDESTAEGRMAMMKAGMTRPASTGVIGKVSPTPHSVPQAGASSSSSVMASLGLIPPAEEDLSPGGPTASSTGMKGPGGGPGAALGLGPSGLRSTQYHTPAMDQIREDSPIVHSVSDGGLIAAGSGQVQNVGVDVGYRMEQREIDQYRAPRQNSAGVRWEEQVVEVPPQHLVTNQGEELGGVAHVDPGGHRTSGQYIPMTMHGQRHVPTSSQPPPQQGITVISRQGHPHQTVYTTAPTHGSVLGGGHHPPSTPHIVQHNPYESQTIAYYTSPPQHGPAQAAPPGSHVYVNAGPYGYATVQYHPHPVVPASHHPSHAHAAPGTRHIIHTHVPPPPHSAAGPHPQEYVSVIPITSTPGGSAPSATSQGANGGYTYWQTVDSSGAPTVTVMNAPGGPPPTIALGLAGAMSPSHQGSTPVKSQAASGRQGGRGKGGGGSGKASSERGGTGRGRKSGGSGGSGRRSSALTESTVVATGASSLLEEFRSNKTRDWTLEDIRGHIVEFCQDQNGSRSIQQRLEVADDAEKAVVVEEVLPAVRRLRNDVFGNYVVQKLLEHGTPEMRTELRRTMEGEMVALSMQMYGCRVVQKALEALPDEDLPTLLAEFVGNVVSCIHDQNGNHVIQKCVEVLSVRAKAAMAAGDMARARHSSDEIEFIINDVLGNVAALSCHPYGCRVLQRILEHCVESQKARTLDAIQHCQRVLLDDQYGNYVIQHVLQYGRVPDRDLILGIVVESGLLNLSRQKYASNVVEKLLKFGTPHQRVVVVREMLKVADESCGASGGGTSVVLLMVRDAYANYVVQTALDVVDEGSDERRQLLEELNSHSEQLRNYTFAKHIVSKLGG